MTGQGLLERRQERDALFAQGGQVAADAAKDRPPLVRTETAGNFLLHLDHAQVAFGLIIVERHGEVVQESQDLPLPFGEPIQEIAKYSELIFNPSISTSGLFS